jgi:hypothetical protein
VGEWGKLEAVRRGYEGSIKRTQQMGKGKI